MNCIPHEYYVNLENQGSHIMNGQIILIYTLIGTTVGASVVWFLFFLTRKQVLKEAQNEADDLLKEAQEIFKEEEEARNDRTQEIELEAWGVVQEQHLLLEGHCEELEAEIQSRKNNYEEITKIARSTLMQKEISIRDQSFLLQKETSRLHERQNQKQQLELNYTEELLKKTSLEKKETIEQITTRLVQDCEKDTLERAEIFESEVKEFAEQKAKRILGLAMDRFSKEMSTERGISASFFPTEEARRLFCQNLSENIAAIRKISGCDIFIDENPDPDRWHQIQVVGYDPVRRELTRRIFDKIFRNIEKFKTAPTVKDIEKHAENIKTELLRQIKRDGDLIAKELGMQNMHPEVRQMMGSLRYRYSYTQNQYFHIAEVGWFANLLAQELGLPIQNIKDAKRSGLLHDLGKALDHELDGSHAVIGADFIAPRGEKPEVVHAVRAHHYDVQPEADIDFLVIAADAISGGRPGARRSTMETYTQKVSGLQEISKRFKGVTDVFVLNGGRECRVLVNSRIVDDLSALQISEQIAKTVEDEMQYPGQIKIVVVRETVTSESTAGKGR